MSSKTNSEDNNCASPNAFNKQRKRKVLAFRDFPLGCGHQRVSSESLNSLVHPKVELQQTFLQDSLDNASVVNSSKVSVCQTIKLPNES